MFIIKLPIVGHFEFSFPPPPSRATYNFHPKRKTIDEEQTLKRYKSKREFAPRLLGFVLRVQQAQWQTEHDINFRYVVKLFFAH